jgi:hypothetical protein
MHANQRVSAHGRGLLAASTASRPYYSRFTVADDAGRGDPDRQSIGNPGNVGYNGFTRGAGQNLVTGRSRSSYAPPELLAFNSFPRRWVVERTLAWLNRNRRLAKDFETSITSTTTWIYIASAQLLIRRLADA